MPRIELASSAGFPSLLDPSSGYTGGPKVGSSGGLSLPPPMQMKPGWSSGSSFGAPEGRGPTRAYASKPNGKPKGGRSPRRGPRNVPRGGGPRGAGNSWDRPLARSWDRPLVKSRMYSSIDSTSSNGGGGRSTMHHSGPFDYHAPLAQSSLASREQQKRPDTSPAHLALESQVQSALKELTGVMEEGVKMFDVPPSTAGPRASTAGELTNEENAALVSRLKDQIRSTDQLVKSE